MRILLDVQGGQSESRYRGIGRYTLSLTEAILKNATDHDVWVLVNGQLLEGAIALRKILADYIPQERLRTFEFPWPMAAAEMETEKTVVLGENFRNFCISRLNPDVILVCSLFEGYVDDAIVSIDDVLGNQTACILYDLIPLSNPERYLATKKQEEFYARKIASIKRANRLLAISESAAKEAVEHLGWDEKYVVNISSAISENFKPAPVSKERRQQLFTNYGIAKSFVLYVPGGFDHRKNFERLIEAYARLPAEVRDAFQLVIASRINEAERHALEKHAKSCGVGSNWLVLTGYVPDDELIDLYRLTHLFVFPSLHEGFGLPVLEAMGCGAPAIGANATSVPEVIGFDEALFDPTSVASIADKITEALTDQAFRTRLADHAKRQVKRFSWDITAHRAIAALVTMHKESQDLLSVRSHEVPRKKLAFLSPMPPERSGISDYSAMLLPALSDWYDITVITQTGSETNIPNLKGIRVKDVAWFKTNAKSFERVVYQFGNSPFHTHMFDLLKQIPGVVVLHDFYLSAVCVYEEIVAKKNGFWTLPLYKSHGWSALRDQSEYGVDYAKAAFPGNLDVLQRARGLIVHSEHSLELIDHFYGSSRPTKPVKTIPLVRNPTKVSAEAKHAARNQIGLSADAIVFASFGFLDESKFNDRVLDAWEQSGLANLANAHLIFVGECPQNEYGSAIKGRINLPSFNGRVTITGWTDMVDYERYLNAADIGVQLRKGSRGETSAAVLDCMNFGLATLVNKHGSMAFLPDQCVIKISDKFTDKELADSLLKLATDAKFAIELGRQSHEHVSKFHAPESCAIMYKDLIESSYAQLSVDDFIDENMQALNMEDKDLKLMAIAIDQVSFPWPRPKRLMIDVTSIVEHDLGTGIERVIKSQLLALLKSPPQGCTVAAIYYRPEQNRFYEANQFISRFLQLTEIDIPDTLVDARAGDVCYVPDYNPTVVNLAATHGQLSSWKKFGVKLAYMIHDLLPVTQPEFFPEGASEGHNAWLHDISTWADQVICISKAVADDYREWLDDKGFENTVEISVVTHGADFSSASPTKGRPDNASQIKQQLESRKTFLMVGTIEPRKGYLEVLNTFESLWSKGVEVNLVIVGREGWTQLEDSKRRTIPETIAKIKKSAYLNSKLIWLPGISDEYLEEIYGSSDCLIAASEGEGFGLPLIEAAMHDLPIIVRDIAIFREVAQDAAYYFGGKASTTLESAIKDWLKLHELEMHPRPDQLEHSSWAQNAVELIGCLLGTNGGADEKISAFPDRNRCAERQASSGAGCEIKN
jgi:glycosyltransferase involved in cell wall biosynthesis